MKLFTRIICFTFTGALVLALVLRLYGGVTSPLGFTDSYRQWISSILEIRTSQDWLKAQIPYIPKIPTVDNAWLIVNVLATFANGISAVFNVLIVVLNVVITVFQFIMSIVFWLLQSYNTLYNPVSSSSSSMPPWASYHPSISGVTPFSVW